MVSPLVPSTMAVNSVVSGIGWPPMSREKSGVLVVPFARICSRRPSKVPVESKWPPMPLMLLRSALNVYVPVSGVSVGSSGCQGPNVPRDSISPCGTGFVSVAW